MMKELIETIAQHPWASLLLFLFLWGCIGLITEGLAKAIRAGRRG